MYRRNYDAAMAPVTTSKSLAIVNGLGRNVQRIRSDCPSLSNSPEIQTVFRSGHRRNMSSHNSRPFISGRLISAIRIDNGSRNSGLKLRASEPVGNETTE